jgi:LPXTG-motif cell wall-anchored protein
VPTYACAAATAVTHNSATLNGSTTDAAATSAVFTLVGPGGGVLNDNDGTPFMVNATGLTPSTAYTYTVVFNPGGNAQTVAAPCGFTTAAAPVVPGPVVPGPVVPPPAPPAEDQCPDQDGFQDNVDQCVEVLPDVIVPETPDVPDVPAVPTEVEGEVVARELPRTGTTTLPLLQVGLGLILLGAGAVLFGRERTALI